MPSPAPGDRMSSIFSIILTSWVARVNCCFLAKSVSTTCCFLMSAGYQSRSHITNRHPVQFHPLTSHRFCFPFSAFWKFKLFTGLANFPFPNSVWHSQQYLIYISLPLVPLCIQSIPSAGFPSDTCCDLTLASVSMGWSPEFSASAMGIASRASEKALMAYCSMVDTCENNSHSWN